MNCLKRWSLIVGVCGTVIGFTNPVLAKVSAEATTQHSGESFTLSDNFQMVIAETYVEETVEVEEVTVEEVVVEEYTEETVEVTEEYTEEVVVEEYIEETVEIIEVEEYSE